ncbi:hypothetical protein [Caenimonas sp. SL110]|uniref:hypothetical protein n=1 Tax=Caenimonas sp. SL110 TaxID=1450524 RepID=UPI0006536940|nr:hypothetical protein [Caenimonas sp. SL110]
MRVQELRVPEQELAALKAMLEQHGLDPDHFSAALSEYQADLGPQVRILKLEGPVEATYTWTKGGAWLEALNVDLEAGLYRSED